jgi:hypothetical protein
MTPLSTPAAQGTVTPEELAKQIADAAADMCEIARIADEWRRGPKQSLTAIREIRAMLSASPSPEALPASGVEVDALVERVEDVVLTDWFRHTSDPEASRRVVVRSVIRRLANLGAITSAPEGRT